MATDLQCLLCQVGASYLAIPIERTAARWVALRIDERRVALAVDAVLRPRAVSLDRASDIPPPMAAAPALTALGTLDSKLLIVLERTRLLASDALARLDGHAAGR